MHKEPMHTMPHMWAAIQHNKQLVQHPNPFPTPRGTGHTHRYLGRLQRTCRALCGAYAMPLGEMTSLSGASIPPGRSVPRGT